MGYLPVYIYTKREGGKGGKPDGEFACVWVLPSIEFLCTLRLLPYAEMNEERESTKQLRNKSSEYDHAPLISYSKGKCSIVKCIAHDKYRYPCHVGV